MAIRISSSRNRAEAIFSRKHGVKFARSVKEEIRNHENDRRDAKNPRSRFGTKKHVERDRRIASSPAGRSRAVQVGSQSTLSANELELELHRELRAVDGDLLKLEVFDGGLNLIHALQEHRLHCTLNIQLDRPRHRGCKPRVLKDRAQVRAIDRVNANVLQAD